MLDPHTKLGIALLVFYLPVAPLSIWLVSRNRHYHPRMAWVPTVTLSLMRLGAGVVLVARQNNETDEALIIAALVLLNVGSLSLVAINLGFVRAIYVDNHEVSARTQTIDTALRMTIYPIVALLTGGASISTSHPATAKILTIAGYSVFAVLLLGLVTTEFFFWLRRAQLTRSSERMAAGAIIAAPFVIGRNVYGLLELTTGSSTSITMWNPLFGNALALALLGLLSEYIPLCIYLLVGFSIPPDRGLGPVHDSICQYPLAGSALEGASLWSLRKLNQFTDRTFEDYVGNFFEEVAIVEYSRMLFGGRIFKEAFNM